MTRVFVRVDSATANVSLARSTTSSLELFVSSSSPDADRLLVDRSDNFVAADISIDVRRPSVGSCVIDDARDASVGVDERAGTTPTDSMTTTNWHDACDTRSVHGVPSRNATPIG